MKGRTEKGYVTLALSPPLFKGKIEEDLSYFAKLLRLFFA
jgi:hypothetical protein